MKILKFFYILIILLFLPLIVYGQESEKLLSCNESSDSEARCTGSAYCTACTNCSRCAHCNSGGSCGVCAGGSSSRKSSHKNSGRSNRENNYNSTKNNRSSGRNQTSNSFTNSASQANNIYEIPDDIFSEYYNKILVINAKELNLRSGPGTNYPVIQKLSLKQEVVFLAMIDDWVKVRVKSNNKIGYIHRKHVLVKD